MTKVQIEITELQKTKLKNGAKYVITIDREYIDYVSVIADGIRDLIGDNFILIPIDKQKFNIYEIEPKK